MARAGPDEPIGLVIGLSARFRGGVADAAAEVEARLRSLAPETPLRQSRGYVSAALTNRSSRTFHVLRCFSALAGMMIKACTTAWL